MQLQIELEPLFIGVPRLIVDPAIIEGLTDNQLINMNNRLDLIISEENYTRVEVYLRDQVESEYRRRQQKLKKAEEIFNKL